MQKKKTLINLFLIKRNYDDDDGTKRINKNSNNYNNNLPYNAILQ